MKILILGSGAREHALAVAVARSPKVTGVWVAPGNAGMRDVAVPLDMSLADLEALAHFARREKVALTIAGSEATLVRGVWDVFDSHNLRLLGPSQQASQLEGSKAWAKEFMRRHDIPTADFVVVEDIETARREVARRGLPLVLKADGLAAGKGVYIPQTPAEAEQALRALLLDQLHGPAGQRVVIERCLRGVELSVFAISDGYSYQLLGTARDHKRAFDGDCGPNTGGMGAFSPVPFVTTALLRDIECRILVPTLAGMLDEGAPFRGFLYLGLMLSEDGPFLLEYNCRLGDPEAQVILPRLQGDFVELCLATDAGDVQAAPVRWSEDAAVGIVLASAGYPASPESGKPVRGLEKARARGVEIFMAGVEDAGSGELVTRGGRILTVVGRGRGIAEARSHAYAALAEVKIDGAFHRADIAALVEEKSTCPKSASAS